MFKVELKEAEFYLDIFVCCMKQVNMRIRKVTNKNSLITHLI